MNRARGCRAAYCLYSDVRILSRTLTGHLAEMERLLGDEIFAEPAKEVKVIVIIIIINYYYYYHYDYHLLLL